MSNKLIAGVGCVGIILAGLVALAIAVGLWAMSVNNTEVGLAAKLDGATKDIEIKMDKMIKTLTNQHKVSDDFAKRYIEAVQSQASGRSGGGLVKLSTEASALGMPPEIFSRLNASIEGQMAEYAKSQSFVQDIWREHTTHCSKAPNFLLLKSRVRKQPEVISSEGAKEAVKSGKLEDNLLMK
ncbi:MAG: hypothetical protein RL095_554 [Verrucomicrobiota bacterium]|jgi:threonine dehydrogenase-like Zn-dependent dehydrogenase